MKKIALLLLLIVAVLVGLMSVFPEDATRIAFSLERVRSGVHQTSLVVDGKRWHYLEGGSADAPVALLLHGFGGDKDNWTRFSDYLTEDFRVIAPDLPGFGDSVRHADWNYSLSAQRDRLTAFVEAVGLDRFHIAGNSMGGHLAALYAHQHPEQIRSLALFNNAGVEAPNPSEVQLAVERGENPLILSSPEDFDRLVALISYKPPFIPWPARRVIAKQAFEHAAFNQTIFDSYRNDRAIGLEPILPEIGVPVLILWGEHDRVLDVSSVDVMRPLLPQAEVVIMPDTGHIPMLERPAETARHFRAFVDGL
jgi:pimeloyl-ACP methyl ester carboxylesterase